MQYSVGSVRDYVSVCSRCGCALKEDQIAGVFDGILQDLETHKVYTDNRLHFCSECKRAIQTYANSTVRQAWLRMQALEHP